MNEEQQQPTYPITNYNVMTQGLMINIQISPTTAISHLVANEALGEIRRLLKERDKQQESQLALIRHVNATKNN
jgi:hypothetical protein